MASRYHLCHLVNTFHRLSHLLVAPPFYWTVVGHFFETTSTRATSPPSTDTRTSHLRSYINSYKDQRLVYACQKGEEVHQRRAEVKNLVPALGEKASPLPEKRVSKSSPSPSASSRPPQQALLFFRFHALYMTILCLLFCFLWHSNTLTNLPPSRTYVNPDSNDVEEHERGRRECEDLEVLDLWCCSLSHRLFCVKIFHL